MFAGCFLSHLGDATQSSKKLADAGFVLTLPSLHLAFSKSLQNHSFDTFILSLPWTQYRKGPSPSSSSQAWLQHCLLQKGSFHFFPPLLHLPPWGSQQSLVQNLAGSGVEHSFPVLCFEHPPYPRQPGRGWDSSGVCLTRAHALLHLRYVTLYRCFGFLGLYVLM